MEEDIRYFSTGKKGKIIESRLEKAIESAEEILNYESAHNEELQQALSVLLRGNSVYVMEELLLIVYSQKKNGSMIQMLIFPIMISSVHQ